MPLTVPQSKLKGWKKFSNNFYLYPTDDKEDGDNHVHLLVENATANPMTVKSISVKIGGKSTNLRVGSALNGFKFKTDGATWPPDPANTRYRTALSSAGLID